MSSQSSNGEVFGANVLYGAMVAMSALVLFAAVASTVPNRPTQQPTAFAQQVAEHVVVTASRG